MRKTCLVVEPESQVIDELVIELVELCSKVDPQTIPLNGNSEVSQTQGSPKREYGWIIVEPPPVENLLLKFFLDLESRIGSNFKSISLKDHFGRKSYAYWKKKISYLCNSGQSSLQIEQYSISKFYQTEKVWRRVKIKL